jgi:hypothetical protein
MAYLKARLLTHTNDSARDAFRAVHTGFCQFLAGKLLVSGSCEIAYKYRQVYVVSLY